MTVIQTKRLRLRPYQASDAADVTRLIGELDVARWLTRVPYPYALKDAQSFIERMQRDDGLCFAILRNDQLMGGVSIGDELGYWLGKPYWGNGFATEAACGIIERHIDQGVEHIQSGFVLGNTGSQNVLRKLGFENGDIEEVASASLGAPVRVQKMHLQVQNWNALQ